MSMKKTQFRNNNRTGERDIDNDFIFSQLVIDIPKTSSLKFLNSLSIININKK